MLKNFTTVAVSLLGTVATTAATMPTPGYASQSNLMMKLQEVAVLNQSMTQETETKEVVPEKPKEK
jgi:hypothetical protein